MNALALFNIFGKEVIIKMISPYFFDENGNTVKNLTQWDSNQKLILESTDDITIAPKIHFCNQNSEKALVVQSSLSNNQITADVPNTLLEEPFNITAYVYLVKDSEEGILHGMNDYIKGNIKDLKKFDAEEFNEKALKEFENIF